MAEREKSEQCTVRVTLVPDFATQRGGLFSRCVKLEVYSFAAADRQRARNVNISVLSRSLFLVGQWLKINNKRKVFFSAFSFSALASGEKKIHCRSRVGGEERGIKGHSVFMISSVRVRLIGPTS